MFLGLPDPDPFVRGMDPDPASDPDPSVIMQKYSKKTLDSYYFVTLFDCWAGGGLLALISFTTESDLHFHIQNFKL
jgi:hypothetical protein